MHPFYDHPAFTMVKDVINFITISQLILFTLIFLIRKQGNNLSNKLLAALFLSYALWLSTYFINWRYLDYFLKHNPHVIYIFDVFAFCIAPTIYLYTLSIIRNDFKLQLKYWLLFIPFIYLTILTMQRLVLRDTDIKKELIISNSAFSRLEDYINYGVLRTMNLMLAFAAFISIFRYRQKSKYTVSEQQRSNLNTLLFVLTGISLVFIFDAAGYVYYIVTERYMHFRDIIFFIMYLNFNGLIYIGLRDSALMQQKENSLKYEYSRLSITEKEVYLKKIKEGMEAEKYYLVPSLTLQDFSNKISISSRYISQVINEQLNQSFNEFVNTYRIEEAKRILINPKYVNYSIMGILMEAGFNSKTVFNVSFKKITGYTPKEYRQLKSRH